MSKLVLCMIPSVSGAWMDINIPPKVLIRVISKFYSFIADQSEESSLKVKMSWSVSVKQELENHLDISMFHALSTIYNSDISKAIYNKQGYIIHQCVKINTH